MKSEALNDFRELLCVETQKLDEGTATEVNNAINTLSRTGNLHGSAGMGLIKDVLAKSIPIRAQVALTLLLRSLTAYGVAVDSKNDIAAELNHWRKGG
jgi:hypothetical protein